MAILGNNQFTDPNYFTIDTAGGTNNKVNVCKTDPAPCDGLVEKVTALIRHTRPGGVALDYNKIVICYENGIIIENGVSNAYLWTDYEYDVPVWVDFTFPAFPTIVSGTTYLIYNITSYNATSTYYSLEVGRGLGGRIGTIAEVNQAYNSPVRLYKPVIELDDRRAIMYITFSGTYGGSWDRHLNNGDGFEPSDNCTQWDIVSTSFKPANQHSYASVGLTASGTWKENYKPSKGKVNAKGLSDADGDLLNISIYDSSFNEITSVADYSLGDDFTLNFSGTGDIDSMYISVVDSNLASWNFSTTTTEGDPGNTYMRFNNADLNAVTAIYIDPIDYNSTDQSQYIERLYRASNKKTLQFLLNGSDCVNPSFVKFTVDSVENKGGYYKLNVTPTLSSGTFNNDAWLDTTTVVRPNFEVTDIIFYSATTSSGGEQGGTGGGTMYLYSKSAWDGPMYDTNATWATVRASNDPDNAYPTNAMTTPSIQSWLSGGIYYIYRVWLWFDCGPLQGSTIDSAKLSIYAYNASGSWGEDVTILKSTHPDEAVDRWNYYFDAFTTDNYGTLNVPYTDGMSYARHEVELNAAGLAYVQACAASGTYAKFCLITTDHDYANSAPTAGSATEINMYYSLFNADHDPRLEIAFTGDSWAPTINAWNDITNTDFWENTPISEPHTSWNGSAWVVDASSSNGLNIKTGSIWQKGFRPTQMRITLSAGGFSYFELWDEDENTIASFSLSGPGGEDTQEISYSGFDLNIKKLGYQSGGSGATISKIEVYIAV